MMLSVFVMINHKVHKERNHKVHKALWLLNLILTIKLCALL
jgi:hypothetical protein